MYNALKNIGIDRVHYIYAIVNQINGKTYIGAHSTNNIDDYYFGSGVALRKAIKKYGKQNFEKIIIQYCKTEEDLYKAEAHIVDEHYINLDWSYNMTVGGRGGFSHISRDITGENNPMYGKKMHEKTKQKLIETNLGNKYNAHTIRCKETGKVYESLLSACEELGLKYSSEQYRMVNNTDKRKFDYV